MFALVQETSRFWLSQTFVRPARSASVLPSASLVTEDALAPFRETDSRRLAGSKVLAVVLVVVVPFAVTLSDLDRRLPIGSKV